MADNNNNKKAPEFVTYNLFGLRPVKAVFQLDCDQLGNLIKQIASQEISGIEDVTYEFDKKSGAVRWYIWFRGNSDHFVDKTTANTMIKAPINRMSKEFQEFAKKFGWNEADEDPKGSNKVHVEKIIRQNVNPEIRGKMNALQISIAPFLIVIFDMLNTTYSKEFSTNPPKTRLRRKWVFRDGPTGKYHALVGIEIEKYVSTIFSQRSKPRANRSGNFN